MWGFFLHNLGLNSVENILKISNISKASRIDQVSAKRLKDGAPVISNHIANTINLSIKLDTFSLKCKIAKIKLLFKKIIKTDAKNYGPIPLSPFNIRRNRQKQDQSQDYLQRNELLHSYQSDFRANHSTDTCLSQVTKLILNGAGNRIHTGMILIDLWKVFGILDYEIS